ncbi:interferon-induced transmembrane protein 1-like [Sceloporus undulatus]|uniref:interferon-induced transmembrane protein 1-like n=1 Tax=Sceloporus undulatus TaxID=8520 RepID=UPI001C4B06E9|nr:interferon-induced transmembrane protein 1-like [Sceloporus undulatus]
MASGAQFPFPPQGNGALPRYEQLKDEHDLGVLSPVPAPAAAPQGPGAPLGSATVIHVPSPVFVAPARDHLPWSLFSTIYLNFCCLGFMALVFSVKARDRKMLGDHSGAGSYGSTAKCLNITALLLSLLSVIVLIILVTTEGITIAYWP